MQHFTSVHDVDDPLGLLRLAQECKENPLKFNELGKGKTLGMLFYNASLRTRMSTELAACNLGMNVISMNVGDSWNMEFEDGVIWRRDRLPTIIVRADIYELSMQPALGVSSRPAAWRRPTRSASTSFCQVPSACQAVK